MVIATEESVAEWANQSSLCHHHWLIESPGGPTSNGVCRICGARREFRNYLEGARWDEDGSSDQDVVTATVARSIPAKESQEEGL